jgi:hypothetical protein
MSQGRHGIKILGVSFLVALGLMAVMATGAQAKTPDFKINGTALNGGDSESITGAIPLGKILIPGLGFAIHCTGGKIEAAEILDGGTVEAAILFTGCTVEGNPNCEIYEEELKTPKAILASGISELVFHGGKHYLVAESASFAILWIHGDKCLFPLETNISGSIGVLLEEGLDNLVNQPIQELTEEEEELLGVGLFFGEEPMKLDSGLGTLRLNGKREGQTFGVALEP